jgi:hypothetical protein
METTVKTRIKEFIQFKGISTRAFEKSCGMSNGYVNALKEAPGAQVLQNILDAFPELSQAWLLKGVGSMILPNYQQKVESGENFTQHGDVTVNQTNDEALLKALDEIAAQRRLTEKVTDQMNALIALLTRRGE